MAFGGLVRLVVRPRHLFESLAGRERRGAAAAVVAASGVALAAQDVLAERLEPAAAGAGPAALTVGVSVLVPFLLLAFWLISARLVDAAASLMGGGRRLGAFLTASAAANPVLVMYGTVRVAQALLDRGGDTSAGDALGLLDQLVLLWFVALLILATRAVYGLPPLNAVAAALLPFAAVAAVLTLLLLVAAVLHAAGVL